MFYFAGASAPNPDLLFVLTQKVSKKVKTAPASLEKLTLSWLKPSKLAPSSLKQDSFKRQLHLFFGSPDKVTRVKLCASQYLSHPVKISIGHTMGYLVALYRFSGFLSKVEVASGNSAGSFCFTLPVAAHSVPLQSVT
jgi:hypothetical protein